MILMDTEKAALLFGPYKTPMVKVGDQVSCLGRDADVVIYDWSLAPIPWPLCYYAGTRAAGRGLLVDEELVRAIRQESAAALIHWWGVSASTATLWRKVFGVGRVGSEGSRRLVQEAAMGGLNARKRPRKVRLWTPEELDWLRQLPAEEVAKLTGRTREAVMKMRTLRKIPSGQ